MPHLAYSSRTATVEPQAQPEPTDRDLLLCLRDAPASRAEVALDALIRRKTRPLVQLVARILGDEEEARDVVQVTFLRLWENRQKFDDRWSPNTWVYRIATNLAIDHLRSRKSRERIHEPVKHHLRRVEDSRAQRQIADLHEREVGRIFKDLSGSLSAQQRLVFLLREIEGLSSQEVAEIAGCRESTVRNHLFNARKVLRRELLLRFPEYARRAASKKEAGEMAARQDADAAAEPER